MLNIFKGGSNPQGKGEKPLGFDVLGVCRIMRHFAIGGKVEFYPEFRKEIMLESLVIAYSINGDFIYSTAGLSCDEKNKVITIDHNGEKKQYSEIRTFRIIVPVFTQSEARLDYMRREELLKVGGLVPGNAITLLAQQQNGQVPILDTTVSKRAVIKEGHYANQTVALLDVDEASLTLTDQRARLRLKTDLPSTLRVSYHNEFKLLESRMIDFSDHSLRLRLQGSALSVVEIKAGDSVMISFNLPGASEQVSLTGDVFRVEENELVIMIKGLVENGQSSKIGQIEILKIKANLLQHGQANLA